MILVFCIPAWDFTDLNGMMKIIHKPQSIANELKTVSNASTCTVLHMELHKPEEEWWIRNM